MTFCCQIERVFLIKFNQVFFSLRNELVFKDINTPHRPPHHLQMINVYYMIVAGLVLIIKTTKHVKQQTC